MNSTEGKTMINREDMLALTRRMTVKRTSITRIAGSYMDIDGFIDGTFNTSFLNLNPVEQEKNLALAKKVPFAKTNKNLKEYKFCDDRRNPDSMWKLLMGMRACGLKNDALMETFYEIVGEHYQADEDYAIYVFHDRYDIPAKGLDHIRQGESERMYEYILCVICPLSGEYEPGEPQCGFLFPAFVDGGAAMNYVDIYQEDEEYPHNELLELLGVERKIMAEISKSGEKVKYRLAEAMKECMKKAPVEKITVKEITEECGVTRQTFYRNFQDKYDLINWYFDKILIESFEHMGEGQTVYESLVNKFQYIQKETLFFRAAFKNDDQNCLRDHDFELITKFYTDRIEGNTGKKMSDKIRFQLEMYCQGSIYMTVQWVLGNHKATPETLARFLSESMPAELCQVFKERGLL